MLSITHTGYASELTNFIYLPEGESEPQMRFTRMACFAKTRVKATFNYRRALLAACLVVLGAHAGAAQDTSAPREAVARNPEATGATLPAEAATGQQTQPPAANGSARLTAPAPPDTPPRKKEGKEKRGSFVVAPIPISSPAVGSGVVPVVAYIFPLSKTDKVSPPSVIGAAGFFTNNDSRGFAVGGQFYFKQNTYKMTAGFGRGNLNYDLYGSGKFSGLKLPLKQTGQAFSGEFLRRVGWGFFLGPRFSTGSSTITLRPSGGNTPPPPPDLGLDTTLTAIGVTVTRDTSLNRFYPTSGSYFKFTSDFFSQSLGSKYSFQSYVTTYAKYWGISKSQVLAYDAYFCATGGAPPFYGNCIYGASNQLRGYVAGKYFDRYMVTTQLEYRLAWPWRFGFVAFGGVGAAIPGEDQLLFRNNSFLPAGGGGLRFQLSKQYHVNLRADVAGGKDGRTFTLGVGEAF